MGYDFSLQPDKHVLTHARAFAEHPAFSLVGGVDPSPTRRIEFETIYKCTSFSDPVAAVQQLKPDVLAVAVPTEHHLFVLQSTLAHHTPRIVLCEKPLAYNLSDARQIVSACELSGCKLFVNYHRRSDPGGQEIYRRIRNGGIRLPVKGIAWYSKGLFHNGSHFIDLLKYWLGDIQDFRIARAGRIVGSDDIEPDVSISFSGGIVHFVAADEECFSHYTVELVAPNGRLRYDRGGEKIVWQRAHSSHTVGGYSTLGEDEEIISSDFDHIQRHVVDQLALVLSGGKASLSTGNEALRTVEHLAAIRDSL
jgi:predicted dehydrogenase